MPIFFKALICLVFTLAYPCYCDWVPGPVLPNVGDANGWNLPEYYSTFQAQNLYGATWLFARGPTGVELFNYNYTTDSWSTLPTLEDLGDSNNWGSDPKYYSTIQVVTVGNNFWLIARDAKGLVVYQYDPLTSAWAPKQGNPAFSDDNQWGNPEYYSTIQALSFGGKIWVFARGPDGGEIHQYDPDTDSWSQLPTLSALSDANKWGSDPKYYSTIQVVILGDSFYLLGRSPDGLEIYQYNTVTGSWSQKQTLPDLSDENGWGVPEQYSTIRAVALQDKIWVFARGEFGLGVYEFDPSTNSWTNKQALTSLSDANGWDAVEYYSTIQPVLLNDTIAVLARGPDGLEYHTYFPLTDSWTSQETLTALSDANNWDKPEYFSTIIGVNNDDEVTVFARGDTGMEVYSYES